MDRNKCFRCMTSDEDFGCTCARELERYQEQEVSERSIELEKLREALQEQKK